jgi:hypothetical protein
MLLKGEQVELKEKIAGQSSTCWPCTTVTPSPLPTSKGGDSSKVGVHVKRLSILPAISKARKPNRRERAPGSGSMFISSERWL